jgi:hypothetical protein
MAMWREQGGGGTSAGAQQQAVMKVGEAGAGTGGGIGFQEKIIYMLPCTFSGVQRGRELTRAAALTHK